RSSASGRGSSSARTPPPRRRSASRRAERRIAFRRGPRLGFAAEVIPMARPWLAVLVFAAAFAARVAPADETCMSPYLPKITGQEDYVYVWTLGIDGVGDGADKLVTIGAKPGSPEYGKVVSAVPIGGRHEAHHAGFTDDRRYLWAGGLDDSRIAVFDVAADPAKPKLVKTIDSFVADSGG